VFDLFTGYDTPNIPVLRDCLKNKSGMFEKKSRVSIKKPGVYEKQPFSRKTGIFGVPYPVYF